VGKPLTGDSLRNLEANAGVSSWAFPRFSGMRALFAPVHSSAAPPPALVGWARRGRPHERTPNIGLAFRAEVWALCQKRRLAAVEFVEQEALNSPNRLAWEAKVLARALKGERVALAELYTAYAGPIFQYVLMPKLANRQAAEDALSETFRIGFERLAQFELQKASVYFWFARIATNKALDMHRARRVSGRAVVNLEAQFGILFDAPQTPDALLFGELQRREFEQRLKQALERLNSRYREVIELRFFKERSREECAADLGIKIGTFDVLLLRATKSLRREWDELSPPSSSRLNVRSKADGK
jgi:RNA polymerase sigma-70 factor, ECF subfamily